MRLIEASKITECVEKLCIDANYNLSSDIKEAFSKFKENEPSKTGKHILNVLIENSDIAKNERVPMCQDTGMAIVFVEVGQDVSVINGNLTAAINEGVRRGYNKGYLRKSVVEDPINRKNTGDNTPAVIHYEIVDGDNIKITVAPKGFGSENMSQIKMLKPSDGINGVKEFIIKVVKEAGPNPCPPIILGIGIGGSFEKCAQMAKKALLRPINESNPNEFYRKLEEEMLDEINKLGIGPQGFGGYTTAIGVNIENYPTHIAGLPVAVNVSCHATRHSKCIL